MVLPMNKKMLLPALALLAGSLTACNGGHQPASTNSPVVQGDDHDDDLDFDSDGHKKKKSKVVKKATDKKKVVGSTNRGTTSTRKRR